MVPAHLAMWTADECTPFFECRIQRDPVLLVGIYYCIDAKFPR